MFSRNKSVTIHASAIVAPDAQLGVGVVIGPYAVIEEGVEIGDRTHIGPHAVIMRGTRLGCNNRIHTGVVIGDLAQDLHDQTGQSGVRIGDRNIFREYVTVHRGTEKDSHTGIGNDNLFMVFSHVGHNARIGNQVILVNNVMLGGYAQLDDQVTISGFSGVHQFMRIGRLSLVGGHTRVTQDVPPFSLVMPSAKNAVVVGLNVIGMRRAGFSSDVRLEIKRLFRSLYPSRGARAKEVLASCTAQSPEGLQFMEFLRHPSRRGFLHHRPHSLESADLHEETVDAAEDS